MAGGSKLRRWLGGVLFCLLLSGCLAAQTQPGKTAVPVLEEPSSSSPHFYYARSCLNDRERQVYDQWCLALEGWQVGKIAVEPSLNGPQAAKVWEALLRDRPEFYWARIEEELQDQEQVAQVTIVPREDLTLSDAQRRQREIEESADQLLEGIGGSPVEIACRVHDALLGFITYQEDLHQADAGTLYGGLVRGSGVCDAYSRSYQYLMQQMGIPSYTVVGINRIRGTSHSWNAVLLEDGWYYVDTTWDDLPPERGELFHDYLLVTLEEMEQEHREDAPAYGNCPPGDSRQYNYYQHYGYCVNLAQEQDWLRGMAAGFVRQLQLHQDHLTQHPEPIFLEIKLFGTEEDYQRCREQFEENLFPLLEAMALQLEAQDLPIDIETTGQVFFSCNDVTRVITLRPRAYQVMEEMKEET